MPSLLHVKVTGLLERLWDSACRMACVGPALGAALGPSISPLVPRGPGRAPGLPNTLSIRVMPWSFAVIVSKYGYFCLQILTNWIDGDCVKHLVGEKAWKGNQVTHTPLHPANRVSWVPSDFSIFPNVFFLFCFPVETRLLVSLQERHPL